MPPNHHASGPAPHVVSNPVRSNLQSFGTSQMGLNSLKSLKRPEGETAIGCDAAIKLRLNDDCECYLYTKNAISSEFKNITMMRKYDMWTARRNGHQSG